MNRRGWRTAGPSAVPSALPTFWKPFELKMWSKRRECAKKPSWNVDYVITLVLQVASSFPNFFCDLFLSVDLPAQFD